MPPPLTATAQRIVTTIVGHYLSASGLSWLHGQGSLFSGFTDRSDLDLVAVWETIDANTQALPAGLGSRRTPYESVTLEQASIDGYDVDVLHVPVVRSRRGWTT